MNNVFVAPASQTFYHHWLAYWKPLVMAALLAVLGSASILIAPLVGLVLYALAAGVAMGVYCFRSWHTFSFTSDRRLIRRRGFMGCTTDSISLFGVITPYQIPFLGKWLDVGHVHLGIPGPDQDIRHIGRFREFYSYLMSTTQPHRDPSVQVVFLVPPFPYGPYDWPGQPEQLPAQQIDPVELYEDGVPR